MPLREAHDAGLLLPSLVLYAIMTSQKADNSSTTPPVVTPVLLAVSPLYTGENIKRTQGES